MPRRTPRITAGHLAVLIATAALFVAVDVPTHAAAVITGANIKNNSVASKDIKNNSLKGGDVKDDSLTGADLLESSLGKVPSATTADTATNATTVPDSSITGAKVADGSLTASDVSYAHGRFSTDLPSVAANGCSFVFLAPGAANLNLTKAAIVVTPPAEVGALDISVTSSHSLDVEKIRLVACNPTAAAINPPNAAFDWIAFNVAP